LQATRGCRPRPHNAGSIPQKRRTVAGAGPRNAASSAPQRWHHPRHNAGIIRAKTPRG